MKHLPLIFLLFLVGCSANPKEQLETKESFIKWGRALIDCPTADVVVTSSRYSDKPIWDHVSTFYVIGCGFKVCCSSSGSERDARSCFPCRKEGWY
jgi:hypothetical protein